MSLEMRGIVRVLFGLMWVVGSGLGLGQEHFCGSENDSTTQEPVYTAQQNNLILTKSSANQYSCNDTTVIRMLTLYTDALEQQLENREYLYAADGEVPFTEESIIAFQNGGELRVDAGGSPFIMNPSTGETILNSDEVYARESFTIESYLDSLKSQFQRAFANSKICLRVDMIPHKIDYTENTKNVNTNIDAISISHRVTDTTVLVDSLRKEYYADVVTFLYHGHCSDDDATNKKCTANGGPNGRVRSVAPTDWKGAYNVNWIGGYPGNIKLVLLVLHELGHILGGRHVTDFGDFGSGENKDNLALAKCSDAGRFRTIMAYDCYKVIKDTVIAALPDSVFSPNTVFFLNYDVSYEVLGKVYYAADRPRTYLGASKWEHAYLLVSEDEEVHRRIVIDSIYVKRDTIMEENSSQIDTIITSVVRDTLSDTLYLESNNYSFRIGEKNGYNLFRSQPLDENNLPQSLSSWNPLTSSFWNTLVVSPDFQYKDTRYRAERANQPWFFTSIEYFSDPDIDYVRNSISYPTGDKGMGSSHTRNNAEKIRRHSPIVETFMPEPPTVSEAMEYERYDWKFKGTLEKWSMYDYEQIWDGEYDNGWVEGKFEESEWRFRTIHHFASPDIDDGASTAFTFEVSGQESITFNWTVSSESWWDKLNFYVDDSLIYSISGEVTETKVYELPSKGVHKLKWAYKKDGSVSSGRDEGYVSFQYFDGTWSSISKKSNGDVIDVEWDYDKNVILQTPKSEFFESCDGENYPEVDVYESHSIITRVSGYEAMSFNWTLKQQLYSGYLELYINGQWTRSLYYDSGGWENVYQELPSTGSHEIEWRFYQYFSGCYGSFYGEDVGYIDNLYLFKPRIDNPTNADTFVPDVLYPNLISQ